MELEAELKKEYKASHNYFEQIVNIGRSFFWLVGSSIMLTVITMGFISIVWLIIFEPNDLPKASFTDFQDFLYTITLWVIFFSISINVIFGLPKRVRNVFKDNAQYRIDRYDSNHRDMDNHFRLTESLLLKHKLIKQGDIDKRKSDLPEGRLI